MSAVSRAQIPINAAVGLVFAVTAQERALVNQLTAHSRAMAFSFASLLNGFFDVIRAERADIKPPKSTNHAPESTSCVNIALIEVAKPFYETLDECHTNTDKP